jgi:hypothetical protein
MIKINKQVAKSKISCFLEINEVVLFFHCNNSSHLNKNNTLFGESITSMSNIFFNNSLSTGTNPTFNQRNNETYKRERARNQNTFQSMIVKNRLGKKAFLERGINSLTLLQKERLFLEKGLQNNLSLEAPEKRSSPKQSFALESSLPLFHGPILLLGCSNVAVLKKGIDACAKNKGILLLGALYQKSIINPSQIDKLIANSNTFEGYNKLVSLMKNPILRPLSLMRDSLKMRCLSVHPNRLIYILKARRQQILEVYP